MSMRPVALHALLWGLILSAILGALILGVLWANPEIMLNDYPADIRAKWGPMTARTKRQRRLAAGVLLVAILAVVVASIATLPHVVARPLPFGTAFVHFAVMFGTFNVIDWLIIDSALVYWQPQFVVLPGTEGLAGYRSYWFHFRGFLLGVPLVLLGSALGAVVMALLPAAA